MRVAVQDAQGLRGAFSFTTSAIIHGAVLAWVALAPLVPPPRPSLYDQEIRPYENKIVWYNLHERLPEITPLKRDSQPPRAHVRSRQTLVAGAQENQRPPQLIWTPAPEIEVNKVLPAPNVVALAKPAPPLRDFTLPPDLVHAQAPPQLPDAPAITRADVKVTSLMPVERPQPRAFTLPLENRPPAAKPNLPAAPELAIASDRSQDPSRLLPPVQAARRTFIPPLDAPRARRPEVDLPAAPPIASAAPSTPSVPGTPARLMRPFAAPKDTQRTPTGPESLPAAPQIAASTTDQPGTLPEIRASRVIRGFSTPAPKAVAPPTAQISLTEAPPSVSRTTEATLAIVGLSPVRELPIPKPQSSQQAGFSAGPQPRHDGGDSSAQESLLTVPGLLTREGLKDSQPTLLAALEPPTSHANLAAAARSVQVTASAAGVEPGLRPVPPPDARLSGRLVYTIAIQMPNVTSYSGSWIVWFAEHEAAPDHQIADMHAPRPLRKVDPKYIPAALDEKVEGKVRLAAVIRKDGHVERVELLQHLDNRLDQSSQDALSKWEFEPAVRNGVPIDVDAVFEIPFHIAPKVPK